MFHLITGAIMGFVALYIMLRCLVPLSLPLPFKALLGLVLFAAAFKLQIMRFFMGGAANTALVPSWLLASSGWLFAAVVVMALLLLARDLSFLGLFAARGFKSAPGLLSAGQWSALLLGLALLISGFGVWQALRVPLVRKVEIAVPGLPPSLDGLRAVQITDLHISSTFDGRWLGEIVDKANALKPDIIFLTGDFVDGSVSRLAAQMAPLSRLEAPDGVYACVGNHEYYSGYGPWAKALRDLGLKLLLNEHAVARHGQTPMVIAGVTDQTASAFNLPMPDIKAALDGSPAGVFRILLAHRPAGAGAYAAQGVNLQLSGHTHGGQIYPLSLVVARFNENFVSGLYRVGEMALYVNSGAGLWNGFPVRIGVPSEITELTLRAR